METDMHPQSMTLRDAVRVLFRQKAVVFTCFVAVTATVFIGLQFKTPQYEAKVKMLISAAKQTESIYYRDLPPAQRISEAVLTQTQIATATPVIERAVVASQLVNRPLDYEAHYAKALRKQVIEYKVRAAQTRLGRFNEEERARLRMIAAVEYLRGHIKVEAVRETNIFTIAVRDYSPDAAALLANIVSRSYVIFDLEQQLAELALKYGQKHQAYMQMKDYIETNVRNLTGQPLSNIEAIGPASVKVIEQAQVPLAPVGPPKAQVLGVGVLLGFLAGTIAAFSVEYLDQTFKSPQEVISVLTTALVSSIPRNPNPAHYQTVADQIRMQMQQGNHKSVLVTSTLSGEGVTSIVRKISACLAHVLGQRTLMIDANLRFPQEKLADEAGAGLGEYLEGKAAFEDVVKDMGGNLFLITSGNSQASPSVLLGSGRMQELLRRAKELYDVVIVDSPELMKFNDSSVLASVTDCLALVIAEGRARRQAVAAAVEPLLRRNIQLIGAIINNRSYAIPRVIYERL